MDMKPPTILVRTNKDDNEALAHAAAQHLIEIADQAPEPIRAQAYAFRDKIREVMLEYLRRAAAAERAKILGEIR